MSERTSTEIDWDGLLEEWDDEVERISSAESRFERAWFFIKDLSSHRLSIIGGVLLLGVAVIAIFAPQIAPYSPTAISATAVRAPPSIAHPMGTDSLGRDILSRVIFGTRIALMIAITSMGIAFVVGSLLGALAGYYGGWVDAIVRTAIDTTWAFPAIIMGLALASILEPDLTTVLIAIGLVFWGVFARLVRGEVLSLRELDFIKASEAIGLSDTKIIFKHLIPNAIIPAFVVVTLQMGNAIAVAASLSFLGLGVQPPTPSWGIMLSTGRQYITSAWWISVFPGLAIVLVIMSFNFLGEGLRDTIDPKLEDKR
ncbi:ABC transporter permease [Halobellus clavatus]|jgi:peptide/nickel transport system permease protein|uniref:Peptide/nickel transport system permease protein n=1 Tax=Halobellus clavatus TaxID=660517 RepID=A0A1H3ID81_9EURY|nr:ABC transporter permease [Halobellus clavatus]SDY25813.1 peptide/nickel transport system permease protein [Halobellus clavatus]